MKPILNRISKTAALAAAFGILFVPAFAAAAPSADFKRDVYPVLKKHCFKCHGPKKQKSDLRLDTLSTDLLKDRPAAETWHDVLNALNLGEMPPEDEPQLSDKDRKALISWLTTETKRAAEAQRKAGSGAVLRRLNRVEYNNTMRDLLGIADDYARDLPPDSVSKDGFKNNGAALRISDMQLEYYLKAAREALSRVIVTRPEPKVFHQSFTETVQDKGRKEIWTNTLARWGTYVSPLEDYPEEGEFIVRIKARSVPSQTKGHPRLSVMVGFRADVSAPSRELARVDVTSPESQTFEFRGRMEQFPLPSKTQSKYPGLLIWARNVYTDGTNPGRPKLVNVPQPKRKQGEKKKRAKKEWSYPDDPDFPQIVIESLEFEGPIFAQWPPKHHIDILFESDLRASDEPAYARQVVRRFMTRAFRRPVKDAEAKTYFAYYEKIRAPSDTLESAMREVLAMVLVSPDFLYLVEPASPEGKRKLNDHELASRLSYFLLATQPDARLTRVADAGKLRQNETLKRQARRLLKQDQAWQFIEQFTDQWLDLGALDRVAINPEFYPDFDNALKPEMRRETQHFFAEILRNDLSALNLLDSDFAVLNEPMARHYGLKGPKGSAFERVALKASDPRGGVLTQGAILLGNSTGADSHPVKRAVWLRDRLLNDPPAPPPPNVPVLDEEDPDFAKLSVRRQLEIHRKDPACADCHRGIDPWGVALEEFGADGLWRSEILRKEKVGKRLKDVNIPVKSEATLPGGYKVTGVEDLKRHLVEEKHEEFTRALTSRLLAYALGRSLELGDSETVDALTKSFAQNDYNLRKLIEDIVTSEPFVTK
jgi:mono/diheme cytochrome c family protein